MKSSSAASTPSKPTSSPGRPDKYPPPLMRLLRSTTSSKSSRSRSRATPLFTRRKRSSAIEEPSSPKVTCIGQVRVRRSSSKSKQRPPPPLKRRPSTNFGAGAGHWFCFWVGKPPTICCSFRFARNRSCFRFRFRPLWRKWVSFFCCRSSDSPQKGSNRTGSGRISSDSYDIRRPQFENREEEFEEEESSGSGSGRVNGSGESTTTPKNALILTRCRSAPQRSSYLASQNWGSPPPPLMKKTEEEENREIVAGTSGIAPIRGDSAAESRMDRDGEGNLEICEEEAARRESDRGLSKTETGIKTETLKLTEHGNEDEEEEERGERIVVLTRCKSEPASFWKERRLESTVSCRNSVETK